ncbi:MAG: hypothetical protein IJ524_06605 [Bacteroidales bacterium]|nr:hypothetical protein [Bacteroidales bacterium]
MKTKNLILACLALLGLMVAACQKEQPTTPATGYTLDYTVDGAKTTVSVSGDEGMTQLLRQLNTFAREGHRVTVAQSGSSATAVPTKDVVTFSTQNEVEMLAWEAARLKENYQVTITFDSQTGTYTGTAVPLTLEPDQDPVIPTSLVGTEWIEHYEDSFTVLGTYYEFNTDTRLVFETDSTGNRCVHEYPTSTNPYDFDYPDRLPFTYTYDSVLGRCEWYNIPGNNTFVMDYNIELDAFVYISRHNDTSIYFRVK